MKHIPNPGGKAAIEQGCKCPVLDNHHGAGMLIDGKQEFWISELCPLHGYAALTSANTTATVPACEPSH